MTDDVERMRRWRLLLGGGDDDGTGVELSGDDGKVDAVLDALYRGKPEGAESGERRGGLGASAPSVARWLGDIRRYFPTSVVQVMQRDAIERLNLKRLLLEPEMLEAVEPDVHLVGTLLALNHVMPDTTRETARQVVRKVVDELEQRLANRARSGGQRGAEPGRPHSRPRHRDIDWDRTIRANLKHYQPDLRTVIPERLIGYGRRQAPSSATSCWPSTRAARWPPPSSTPRCSAPCWRRCARCARRWSCSTRRWST